MSKTFRVAHYVNQFFGGLGAEEQANVGPQIKDSFVILGKVIQDALKDRGEVVATVICGDNYFAEKTEGATEEILRLLTPYKPDMLIAGPAFNAGRYGMACGELCKALSNKLGIAAVTGMYKDNPGVDLYKKDIYIVRTTDLPKDVPKVVSRMVNLGLKIASKEKIGKPSEEGYFPRGILVNEISEKAAAERAVSMILAKIAGQPIEPEIPLPRNEKVAPPAAVIDLTSAKIGIVTDGGLVPKGNPEKLEGKAATKFGSYSFKGLDTLISGDWESVHIGYDTRFVNQDPNRLVPVDIMRDLEKEGVIGKLNETYYAVSGVVTTPASAKNLGQGIADRLKADGVTAIILTST